MIRNNDSLFYENFQSDMLGETWLGTQTMQSVDQISN